MVNETGGALFEYVISDHLGNSRVVFGEGGGVVQEDHYYPFGLKLAGLVSSSTIEPHQYTYNGKELEDDHDLWWYHYGVRYYDPQVARWMVIDPADQFFSPYSYVGNNPTNIIDPDGAIAIPPDLVLTDNNGNEIRFVTGAIDDEIHLPVDFGGSHLIDLSEIDPSRFAIGWQVSASANATFGVGLEGGMNFTFMNFIGDETYGNYWYSYFGEKLVLKVDVIYLREVRYH